MFPTDFRDAINENTPQPNPIIADGLVTAHIKEGEARVDSVWRVAQDAFPPGLKYVGCRRVTPEEEFYQRSRKRNSQPRQYNLAPSQFYHMEYILEFNGQRLDPVYMQLPYVEDGGTIKISGSRYVVSPVLSDQVISISKNSVFAKLLQIKLTFVRDLYCYHTNSPESPQEIVQIVSSKIWNGVVEKLSRDDKINAKTTIAHYMFARYGATAAFQKFANATPVFGFNDQITEEHYPQDEWIICRSAGISYGRSRNRFVEPSALAVAVKKSEYNRMTRALLAGLFYVTDSFTYRRNYTEVDNHNSWRIMLGILIFGRNKNEGTLLADINEHISSMDKYMDVLAIKDLERIGFKCNDIYEFFAMILDRIDMLILSGDEKGNSRYDKELSILPILYFDVQRAIITFCFELGKQLKKGTEVTHKKIQEVLKTIKPGAIYALKKSHGEITTDDYVGDCKLFKTTAMVTPQSRTTKLRSQAGQSPLTNPENVFHVSFGEVNVLTAMTKASPSGDTRLSPYINIDSYGRIIRDENLRGLMDFAEYVMSRT